MRERNNFAELCITFKGQKFLWQPYPPLTLPYFLNSPSISLSRSLLLSLSLCLFFRLLPPPHALMSRQHVFLKDISLDLAVDVFIKGPECKCEECNKRQNGATGRSMKAGQLQSHPLAAACWWELMWQPICRKRKQKRGSVCMCVFVGGVLELNLSSHGAAIYSNLFAWPWSLHSTFGMEWQSTEGLREWTRGWFEGHIA